ncbi:Catenin-beta-like protein [Dipodascopsis tothii]|uniref:Catenin-beta-like protein n=1 Tax=Dipodascopsis tothii TaxID=44089 RepID=UPI0034CEBDAC
MTDVDAIFKTPDLPEPKRRRLGDLPNPVHAYQTSASESEPEPAAPVEEPVDLDEHGSDDDEGGRFFGGGMTAEQREILDFVDKYEDDGEITFDSAWVRRTVGRLERAVARNEALRARHADAPQRFMASEEELDEAIKKLSALTEHAELYPDFVQAGGPALLTGVLLHENTDVALEAAQVLAELTDEDVAAAEADAAELAAAVADASAIEYVVLDLDRLDEAASDAERAGVFQLLSVVENLAEEAAVADRLFADADGGLLRWLLARIGVAEAPVGQNKQYAAEVLSIVLQRSRAARDLFCAGPDGVDALLRQLSRYRAHDPPREDTDEVEFVQNLFDALLVVAGDAEGRQRLHDAEGVELLLLLLRSGGRHGRARAMKVLDYAMATATDGARAVARTVVAAGGLSLVFKALRALAKGGKPAAGADAVLGVVASLLRHLPDESEERVKVLARFVERGCDNTVRLAEIRDGIVRRLARTDADIADERARFLATQPAADAPAADRRDWDDELEGRTTEWYITRLDHGLGRLQTVDTIAGWLAAEDDDGSLGVRDALVRALRERGAGLADVRDTLDEYRSDVAPDDVPAEVEQQMAADEREQRAEAQDVADMLGVLLEFL